MLAGYQPRRRFSRPNRRRHTPLQLEPLESRQLLAVTATLNAGVLQVAMSAAGDFAVISSSGPAITVNGQAFNGARMLNVQGASAPNQVVDLEGQVNLGSHVSIASVSAVLLNGTWRIGDFNVNLSAQPGGILGNGAFTVLGNASFQIHNGLADVSLNGPNDFQGEVSIVNAHDVSFTNTTRLRLDRLRVVGDASLTSSQLVLTGGRRSYESLRRGALTLQPFSKAEPITVGGIGGYSLTQDQISELSSAFGAMTVGRADGSNAIDVRHVVLPGTFTIRTSGTGAISVDGEADQGSRGALTLAAPTITLNANVRSSGSGISFLGPVIVGTPKTVDVHASGNVVFAGRVDDDAAPSVLQVETGNSDVAFGPVGTSVPLVSLRIQNVRNVTFNGAVVAGTVVQHGSGTTTLRAPLVATSRSAGTNVDLEANLLNIRDSINAPSGTVRLRSKGEVVDSARIVANQLALEGGGYRLTSPTNGVTTLTASISGDLVFVNSKTLTVGHRGGGRAIFTQGHPVALTAAGDIVFHNSTVANGSTITLSAHDITQAADAPIASNNLVINATARVALSQARNDVKFLSAKTAGSLSLSTSDHLSVVDQGGLNGISTAGGNVLLETRQGQGMTIAAPIDTRPGTGGKLQIVGRTRGLVILVNPTLGAGNVVLDLQ